MLILLIAYLGGVLTILSPCILPVLPLVLARADRPFRSHGLPMLSSMAVAFAVVATLAAVGGGWAITFSAYGRYVAMALLALFGFALLWPGLADRLSRPFVELGNRLTASPAGTGSGLKSTAASLALGVGTALLWTPCAGPILGLILTGAALHGASAGTSLLLLAYAAGACTSLAAASVFGRRLVLALRGSEKTEAWIRRAAGAAVLLSVGAVALGADTGFLGRLSISTATGIEEALTNKLETRWTRLPRLQTATMGGDFPPLEGATEWINSPPLTPESLRGKVVLVDFWTYSCINCLRTLPYVRAWAQRYKDAGLVVIGVHAPEFAFEKRSSNVRRAIEDLHIDFPVAVDSDFAIWRAFGNRYWPAFYFVDARGRIRHHQFGENRYDEAEQVIRQLLAEAGQPHASSALVSVHGEGVEAAPGSAPILSDETYLGYARARGFASPGGIVVDRSHTYRSPASLRTNQWSLSGAWTVESERIVVDRAGGRIAFRFQARDLHLVLGPAADGRPVRFKVLVDGHPPSVDRGSDVDAQGNGTIDAQRLYQLVRRTASDAPASFEIEFIDPGAQAYVFTFG